MFAAHRQGVLMPDEDASLLRSSARSRLLLQKARLDQYRAALHKTCYGQPRCGILQAVHRDQVHLDEQSSGSVLGKAVGANASVTKGLHDNRLVAIGQDMRLEEVFSACGTRNCGNTHGSGLRSEHSGPGRFIARERVHPARILFSRAAVIGVRHTLQDPLQEGHALVCLQLLPEELARGIDRLAGARLGRRRNNLAHESV